MALGLLAGLVMGCASALLKDHRTGKFFTCNELLHSLPVLCLSSYLTKTQKKLLKIGKSQFNYLADGPLKGASTVALILWDRLSLKTSIISNKFYVKLLELNEKYWSAAICLQPEPTIHNYWLLPLVLPRVNR